MSLQRMLNCIYVPKGILFNGHQIAIYWEKTLYISICLCVMAAGSIMVNNYYWEPAPGEHLQVLTIWPITAHNKPEQQITPQVGLSFDEGSVASPGHSVLACLFKMGTRFLPNQLCMLLAWGCDYSPDKWLIDK